MTDNPQPRDFDGKIALVTGASRGIGEATARLLAARGAHVIVSSRRQESVDEVAASIRESGGEATGIACHVGDSDSIDAIFGHIASDFGRLDATPFSPLLFYLPRTCFSPALPFPWSTW